MNSMKDSIKILACKARDNIIQNKYLIEKIKLFNQQISLVKNIISKSISLTTYKNLLSSLNSELKQEINKEKNKQKDIIKKLGLIDTKCLSPINIDNFILDNTLHKLKCELEILLEKFVSSKQYEIFREPKRETELDIKDSNNVFQIYNLEMQQKMLSYCRSYTNYRYKNNQKIKHIDECKNFLVKLNDAINFYNSELNKQQEKSNNLCDIKDNKKFDSRNKKILKKTKTINKLFKKKIKDEKILKRNNSFDKKNIIKKEKNKKINILKIDELLDISNIKAEDENVINDELDSDDEVCFEKKIKPKNMITSDLIKGIPTINLSQIEFNKIKVINEADAYSLQKRNFEMKNINWQIKSMKKQICILENQIDINKNKLNVIHNFISDVKDNYKLLRTIKVQTSAAGNAVNYIREKLEESINKNINKVDGGISLGKKTEKTAVDEGDELVGSDYSDEDEYMDNDKGKINNIKNKDIKENLMNKFEEEKREENLIIHEYFDDIKYNGALSK